MHATSPGGLTNDIVADDAAPRSATPVAGQPVSQSAPIRNPLPESSPPLRRAALSSAWQDPKTIQGDTS